MMTPLPNLNRLTLLQVAMGLLLGSGAWAIEGLQLGASIATGALLMAINVALLGWTWSRLLEKKSIAWTVVIIVIKYAFLLGSIFYVARVAWFSSTGVGLGVFSFVLTAMAYALMQRESDRQPSGSAES